MNKKTIFVLLLSLILNMFITGSESFAQENDSKPTKTVKSDNKETEQIIVFSKIDSLVNSRQFVFQSEYYSNSDLVFVVVDSVYGEVQNGIRNNLQGKITQFKVNKNEKKKTISITIKMRGDVYSADVFLFIGESGVGKATIKSYSPGYFTFDGRLVDFENSSINEWPSHFVN